MTQAQIGKISASIGYAIGVLEGLADMTKLNERQKECVDSAIEGLREIDLCALIDHGEGKVS